MTKPVFALLAATALSPMLLHGQGNLASKEAREEADWDWTAGEEQTLFYGPAGQTPTRTQVLLPFVSPGNRVYQSPGDCFKEDGWMLVHRAFGTDQAAPALPYFTLYNQFRGLFRVMIHLAEPGLYLGSLRVDCQAGSAQQGSPLLTFTNTRGRCLGSDFDRDQADLAVSPVAQANGWAVFDFCLVGYDPDLASKDPLLRFTLRRLREDPSQAAKTMVLPLIKNLSMTTLGSALAGDGQDPDALGFHQYRTLRHWVAAEAGNKLSRHTLWYSNFQMLGRAGAAGSGTLVGALGGQVEAWLGGSDRACAWEPISFRGQLPGSLDGSSAEEPLLAIGLYLCLPKSLPGQAGGVEPRPGPGEGQRPVQRIPWGLFNLEACPQLVAQPFQGPPGTGLVKTLELAGEPRLLINPDLAMDLVSVSYRANLWTREPARPGGELKQVYSGLLPISVRGGPAMASNCSVSDLLLKLKFRTRQPTRDADAGYTVVKRVPCVLTRGETGR